jgi:hypothetical protein
MKARLKYKADLHYSIETKEMEMYRIKKYSVSMNHWESWIDIEFKNEHYYTLFMIAHGCHFDLY